MKCNGSILLSLALSMVSGMAVFAQRSTDEQSTTEPSSDERPSIVAPVPQVMRYCWARMLDENKMLELVAVSLQDADTKTHYDVSLPNTVNGNREGYRTERREATRVVTTVRSSCCELETRAFAVYQPDGMRLSVQEIADRLKLREFTPVVLSNSRPDDLMATVLASDCMVIVVPDEGLKFQVRDQFEK